MAATAASELFSADVLDGKIFSGGWIAGSERLATTEPATGEQLAEVGAATPQDVHRAAEIAGEAQTAWAATDPHDRAAILLRAADVIEANKDEIIGWIVRETGSIPPKADFEIGLASAELKEAAALAPRMRGEVIPEPEGKLSIAQRVPIGVVGVIAPWNFPLMLGMRSVAPALALGNAVILKPDPQHARQRAASSSRASSRRPGCPRASLQVLPGGAETGQAVCTHPQVGMIQFTGSTAAGRKVGAPAGRHLKKVVLELGGKSALIVLEDADLDLAAALVGAWGSFLHQGQICMASGRALIHEQIAAGADRQAGGEGRTPAGGRPHERTGGAGADDQRQAGRARPRHRARLREGGREARGGWDSRRSVLQTHGAGR